MLADTRGKPPHNIRSTPREFPAQPSGTNMNPVELSCISHFIMQLSPVGFGCFKKKKTGSGLVPLYSTMRDFPPPASFRSSMLTIREPDRAALHIFYRSFSRISRSSANLHMIVGAFVEELWSWKRGGQSCRSWLLRHLWTLNFASSRNLLHLSRPPSPSYSNHLNC